MLDFTANSGLFMFDFLVPVKVFEIIRYFETGRTLIYPELNSGFLFIVLVSFKFFEKVMRMLSGYD